MKTLLFTAAIAAIFLQPLRGQSDDLTVTTATGKVLTFPTEEQKEKYLARVSQLHAPPSAPPAPAATAGATPAATVSMGHTSLDAKPTGTGKVNVGAPVFTANYYMLEPETWVGKPLTLSVAYIVPTNERARADGMQQLRAHTWGRTQVAGDQSYGGSITILATPEAARRITMLCGNTFQYNQMGVKLTLIKGEMTVLNKADKGTSRYGLVVSE